MSGLKYTPERAQQAANQERARHLANQRVPSSNGSNGSNGSGRGCLVFTIAMSVIIVVSVYAWAFSGSESNSYDKEKADITKYVCDEIYSVSYGELESSSFNNNVMIKMSDKAHQKEYMFNREIKVSHPDSSDNIKAGVEYKKVMVTIDNPMIGKIVNEYAAVLNEDGSFTLEPMADFQNRMHK